MSEGVVRQIGTPEEIYNDPAGLFVADFVGASNFLEGAVISRSRGMLTIKIDGLDQAPNVPSTMNSGPVVVAVRPEALTLLPEYASSEGFEMSVKGSVLERSYHGHHFQYRVGVGFQSLTVETRERTEASHVRLGIPATATNSFLRGKAPRQGGRRHWCCANTRLTCVSDVGQLTSDASPSTGGLTRARHPHNH